MAVTATIVAGKSITILPSPSDTPTGNPDTVGLRPTTEIGIAKRSGPVLPAGYTARPQWIVWVRNADQARPLVIPMGKVTNQGTWLNTQAGAIAAQAAIAAALP